MKIVVSFFLFCGLLFASNINEIKTALIKEYTLRFPSLIVKNVELRANGLPDDFDKFEFIRLDSAKFNRSSGYVRALFKSPQNMQRSVFFRYFIEANLQVLRASKPINKGDKLNALGFSLVYMSFDKVPSGALMLDDNLDLIAKTSIKKNAILRQNMFKQDELVKRGDVLRGLLKDGEVQIFIELVAIENGNKGEKIRLKNKEGKVMQGVIISKTQVELQ